jgi:hypothetical protein
MAALEAQNEAEAAASSERKRGAGAGADEVSFEAATRAAANPEEIDIGGEDEEPPEAEPLDSVLSHSIAMLHTPFFLSLLPSLHEI